MREKYNFLGSIKPGTKPPTVGLLFGAYDYVSSLEFLYKLLTKNYRLCPRFSLTKLYTCSIISVQSNSTSRVMSAVEFLAVEKCFYCIRNEQSGCVSLARNSRKSAAVIAHMARGGRDRGMRSPQRHQPSQPFCKSADSATNSCVPARHFSGQNAKYAQQLHFVQCDINYFRYSALVFRLVTCDL